LAGAIGQVLQNAARGQADALAGAELDFHGFVTGAAMVEMVGLFMHILMQAAAQGDIHFLNATADTEQGHIAFHAGAGHFQGDAVAAVVEQGYIPRLATIIVPRVHVGGAAREDHAVDIVQQCIHIGAKAESGQQQGHRAANPPHGDHETVAGAMAGMMFHIIVIVTDDDDDARSLFANRPGPVAVGGIMLFVLHIYSLSRRRPRGKA